MRTWFTFALLAACAALTSNSIAVAQGSDSCATPTTISGTGSFTFDNTTVTTGPEGQTEASCNFFGSTSVDNDVWFVWLAPATGPYRLSSCTAVVDTKVAVYPGSACPTVGSALACNDDQCGFQSDLTFSATLGNSYVIQIGTFPGAPGGVDSFQLTPFVPPAEDSCSTPLDIGGSNSVFVDTTLATTGAQGQTEPACNIAGSAAIHKDVWLEWTAPTSDTYSFDSCATFVDTKLAVYAGSGCPASSALGCDDDSCSGGGGASRVALPVIAGSRYTIQVGAFSAGVGFQAILSIAPFVPPPPCGTNTGPDVIVGELTDVLNTSPVGGVDAVALGTTSCNIGTALLNWVAGTNDHPVIRQNLYRYKLVDGAGRFEQIGMSWLKHGFFALQNSDCCTCQSGGSGSALGIGCSDPYGAGLNGSQSSLGPNWQVNAHTGVFNYPPSGPPFNGTVARRCQVLLSDLEATSGSTTRFFGEGHYVTKDDAAAGNQNNNVSWREMSVLGTSADYSLNFQGNTARTQPALRAWAAAESGVTLTDAQVPGDGLIVVGSKATQTGPTTWHYEYAVYNMNADRNVGLFAIPLPASASLENQGSHTVPHHSGDGPGGIDFSSQPWAIAREGGHVIFSCESFASNSHANAIRWGTLYNFRFDSDAAPASGDVRFGLWKPGSPAFVAAAAQVPAPGPFTMTCAGDASGPACPCGNNGSFARGCANSRFGAGALLWASGTPSVSNDTLRLESWDVTGPSCLFYQGDMSTAPMALDDGLNCVAGTILRLGTRPTVGFASHYPMSGDPSVSVRGMIPAIGGTYVYQAHYRNAVTSFCPTATSNRSNGLSVTWSP